MKRQVIFLFLTWRFFICIADCGDQKRLLLDDPTVISNRLTRLENALEILNRTVNQQAMTIQHQETTIQHQETTIQQQATTIQQQSMTIQAHSVTTKQFQAFLTSYKGTGSTYVVWGRKQCPSNNHTDQIYSGFAAGGRYDETGSAAEYVCLSPDPKFSKTSGPDYGRMYGAEYESNFWTSNSDDEDVPCTLCWTSYSSTVMIPGTNVCYSGWTREYYGYLASGNHGYAAASSYVCVDINPQYLNSGVADMDGKLFYNVLAKCGSLPCPPYINNYPLMCAVCSK